jgi:prepilin signal peptidase PulO-like enzyme (type II secretory pathway)
VYEPVIYFALVLFGLCLGSFAGATVWRLRAHQLETDKKAGEEYDKKEYASLKKLLGKKTAQDRSRCLHCGYELKWYDLIPLVSWLSLKGKCRSCKKSIGYFEPIMELGTAAFFVVSYAFWPFPLTTPFEIAHLGIWLIAGVIMAVLWAYDAKWYLLPDRYSLALTIAGVAAVLVSTHTIDGLLSVLGAVAIMAGLYGVLFFVSKGRWVGFGDVKLGLGLGLLLGDWMTAFLALFLANFIGCLIVIPLLAMKKLKRNSRVPFGPLLIVGTIIAFLWGQQLLNWYLGFLSF